MPDLTITITDAVWHFLNKRGEPAEVAKRIIEEAWEIEGWNDVKCDSTTCTDKSNCSHANPHTPDEYCKESCIFDSVAECIKVI